MSMLRRRRFPPHAAICILQPCTSGCDSFRKSVVRFSSRGNDRVMSGFTSKTGVLNMLLKSLQVPTPRRDRYPPALLHQSSYGVDDDANVFLPSVMGCPDEEGACCPATVNHPSREEGIVVCMQWAVQTRKSGFMYLYK